MRRLRATRNTASSAIPDPAAASDEVLVRQAQRNPDDFSPLFDRYWDPVFRYCYYRTGDWHEAEDAASQVFINVLNGLANFAPGRGESPFRSWLFSIAHNVVINAGIKNARHQTAPLELASTLASERPGPEDMAISAENHRLAHSLMLQVRPDQRELLELRLAGLSSIEIARVLGRSHGSVRTAQHGAIESLRQLMQIDASSEVEESHA